jgi:hypothetical protein
MSNVWWGPCAVNDGSILIFFPKIVGERKIYPYISKFFRTYRNFSWTAKFFSGKIVNFSEILNFGPTYENSSIIFSWILIFTIETVISCLKKFECFYFRCPWWQGPTTSSYAFFANRTCTHVAVEMFLLQIRVSVNLS